MNVLIVGLGSIAKKHIHALNQLIPDVHLFALRSSANAEEVENVKNVSSLTDCPEPDFIIISNPTAFHADAIRQVAVLKKPLFIEKPPFHTLESANECLSLISKNKIPTYTALPLRFLDCLRYLKKNTDIHKVQEVNIYCGSYLPSWRTNIDYKKNYSSNASMGGGVHLDLIHELDYAVWIFGEPLEVKKVLRSGSHLQIDAVDYANYVLVYPHFVINVVLNYYRRDAKRSCEIVFDDSTWNVNLLKNQITTSQDDSVLFQSEQTTLDIYKDQMHYFCDALKNNKEFFNSLNESVNILKIVLS